MLVPGYANRYIFAVGRTGGFVLRSALFSLTFGMVGMVLGGVLQIGPAHADWGVQVPLSVDIGQLPGDGHASENAVGQATPQPFSSPAQVWPIQFSGTAQPAPAQPENPPPSQPGGASGTLPAAPAAASGVQPETSLPPSSSGTPPGTTQPPQPTQSPGGETTPVATPPAPQPGPAPAVGPVAPAVQEVKPEQIYLRDADGTLKLMLGWTMAEFDELVRLREKWEQRNQPPAFVLQEIHVTGKAADDYAELTVHAKVQLQTDRACRVPLRLEQLILQELPQTTDGKPLIVTYGRQDGGYVIFLQGTNGATQEIVFKGWVPIARVGTESKLLLSVPEVSVSDLQLDVPMRELEVTTTPGVTTVGIESVPSGGKRITLAGLGPGFILTWTSNDASQQDTAPILEGSGRVLVKVSGAVIDFDAQLSVTGQGTPFDHFRVVLPEGARLVSATPSGLTVQEVPPQDAGAVADRRLVEVSLPKKTTGPVDVRLAAQRSLPSEGWIDLAGFAIQDAVRQSGYVGISTASDKSLVWGEVQGLRRIEQFPLAAGAGEPDVSYEYFSQPYVLAVQVIPRVAFVTVMPKYRMEVSPEELKIQAVLVCQVRGGEIASLDIEMRGWKLQEAFLSDQTVPLTVRGTQDDKVNLAFPQRMGGRFEVAFNAVKSVPPESAPKVVKSSPPGEAPHEESGAASGTPESHEKGAASGTPSSGGKDAGPGKPPSSENDAVSGKPPSSENEAVSGEPPSGEKGAAAGESANAKGGGGSAAPPSAKNDPSAGATSGVKAEAASGKSPSAEQDSASGGTRNAGSDPSSSSSVLDAPSVLDVPLPRVLAQAIAGGELLIVALPDLELVPDSKNTVGLVWLSPPRDAATAAPLNVWGFRIDKPEARLVAAWSRHTQEMMVEVETQTVWEKSELNVEERVRYTVRYEPWTAPWRFRVPAEVREQLVVLLDGRPVQLAPVFNEAPNEAPSSAQPTAPGVEDIFTVAPPTGVLGVSEIVFRYSVPISPASGDSGRWKLPVLQPLDGRFIRHRLTVVVPVAKTPNGVEPPWQMLGTRTFGTGPQVEIQCEAREATAGIVFQGGIGAGLAQDTLVVEKMLLQSRLDFVMRQDRCAVRFRTLRPQLTLHLPRGARSDLVQVFLDGQAVQAQASGRSEIIIPMPQSSEEIEAALAEHLLEFAYEVPRIRHSWGRTPLDVPHFGPGAIVSRVYWEVVLLPDEHIVWTGPEVTSEYRWAWHGFYWGRVPTLSQGDLEKWAGLANGWLHVPTQANRYLFGTLREIQAVNLWCLRRSWIVAVCSGCIVAAGLVCVYLRGLGRRIVAVSLLAAVVTLLLLRPEAALLAGEASALGLALLLLGLFLYRAMVAPEPVPTKTPTWSDRTAGDTILCRRGENLEACPPSSSQDGSTTQIHR